MKKISCFFGIFLLFISFVSASLQTISVPISPIVVSNNAPEAYAIDITQPRTENYLFTGEELTMHVLVRDIDGASDIKRADGYVGGGSPVYQEHADSYKCEGSFNASYPCSNAYDGDWDTYALSTDASASYIYMNYTKPSNSVGAVWQTKDTLLQNISIPSDCWDYDSGKLMLRAELILNGDYYDAGWSCYNGDWRGLLGVFWGNQITEEGIFWTFGSPSKEVGCYTTISITEAGGSAYVQSKTGKTYNSNTDKIYRCILTAEPGFSGEQEVTIRGFDSKEAYGEASFGNYIFNPMATIDISTSDSQPLTFGEMDTNTRISESNGLVIQNQGIVGIYAFIAGTNFYASPSTGNHIKPTDFEYNHGVGWTQIPPYTTGSTSSCTASCHGGNPIPGEGVALDTGDLVNLDVRLNVPLLLKAGSYTEGSIYIIVAPAT